MVACRVGNESVGDSSEPLRRDDDLCVLCANSQVCTCGVAEGIGEEQVKAIKRLLQTLDVADDGTISKKLQTRDWYREAYGLEPDPFQLTSQ